MATNKIQTGIRFTEEMLFKNRIHRKEKPPLSQCTIGISCAELSKGDAGM